MKYLVKNSIVYKDALKVYSIGIKIIFLHFMSEFFSINNYIVSMKSNLNSNIHIIAVYILIFFSILISHTLKGNF